MIDNVQLSYVRIAAKNIKPKETMKTTEKSNTETSSMDDERVLAEVNYNAMDTWLEPYIGMKLQVKKKGTTKVWFYMDYGNPKMEVHKIDRQIFNFC